MAEDVKLIAQFLARMEGDDLEFKRDPYPLESDKQKAELIKDIVCMANTPRSGSAYIVLGVATDNGRPTEVLGCASHPDPAELQRIVAGRTSPIPKFSYRVVGYEGKALGLLEMPPGGTVPVMLRNDYDRLRKGVVYLRRNTECIAADQDDIRRIVLWAQQGGGAGDELPQPSGSWEALYRECDAFDQGRVYIAVLGSGECLSQDDWTAFALLGWDLVIDFDQKTDTSGAFSRVACELGRRRSLEITALDDAGTVGTGSSIWVAALGLQSRPSTIQSRTWREWNHTKLRYLARWTSEVARVTEPKPATAIVFGGDPPYVESVCDVLDQAFATRLVIVFATPQQHMYSGTAEKHDARVVSLNLAELCANLRHIENVLPPTSDFELPKLGGGTAVIPPERARWVEEEFEILHLAEGISSDAASELRDFLRGFPITWYGLSVRVDIDRSITPSLESHVRHELASRDARRVNLFHWPGAGGSTLGRRVAWDLHTEFPTVIARAMNPRSASERLRYLFNLSRLPLLVLVEALFALSDDLDRLYDEVRTANVPAVFLRIERRVTYEPSPGRDYLDAMLSTGEAAGLVDKLGREVPDRVGALQELLTSRDRRHRTPFYFGLLAFEEDFKGLEPYVQTRLERAEEPVISVCRLVALAYHFAQRPVPIQLFGPVFQLPASHLLQIHRLFAPELQELFVQLKDGAIRPVHELVAEEMLEQLLSRGLGERRNWRNYLADTAIEFAHLCAKHHYQQGGSVARLLHAVFIERSTEETPAGPWEGAFSPLVSEIPTMEGQQRVFETLTDLFPQEAHFWAHLGRFYTRRIANHQKSHEAHQQAIDLAGGEPVIRHMAGMSWRAELYHMLDSASANDVSPEFERRIQGIADEAKREFAEARRRDARSEYNYISEIQMIERILGIVANLKGFREDMPRFLALRGSHWYRDLLDHAEELLSELSRVRAGEAPSRFQQDISSRLHRLHGEHSKAIEGWTNLLAVTDVYKPPVRRMVIRAYLSRSGGWSSLSPKELSRVSELARQNLTEEASDPNLRLWLQAVRRTEEVPIERAAEELGYRRLQQPSVDTLYYLYIIKFLQAEMGVTAMAREAEELMNECSQLAAALPHRTRAFEWLGQGGGWQALVHVADLGEWDSTKEFWSHEESLKKVTGRISRIASPGSGEIELPTALRAFFVPSRGRIEGGYVRGQDIGRQVEFYLGFSYDGLRAWRVGDVERGDGVQA